MTWQSIALMASTHAPALQRWAVPETMWLAVWGIGLIDLAFAARIRHWWKADSNQPLYRQSHRHTLHAVRAGRSSHRG